MRVITAGAVTTPVINIRIVSSGCTGRICALRCVIVRQMAMGRGSRWCGARQVVYAICRRAVARVCRLLLRLLVVVALRVILVVRRDAADSRRSRARILECRRCAGRWVEVRVVWRGGAITIASSSGGAGLLLRLAVVMGTVFVWRLWVRRMGMGMRVSTRVVMRVIMG